MAAYHGDIKLGDTIDIQFTTVQTTGAPFTLAGSPVVSAYIGNSTTEITAGITLTVDLDGRTGLNNVRIVATGGNGFATGTDVSLVITVGAVNSVSVAGYCVGAFSIEKRVWNLASINQPDGATAPLGIVDKGTAQAGSATTIQLRSAAAIGDGVDALVFISGGTGAGQCRFIESYNGTTKTATVAAWTTNPDNTSVYEVFAGAASQLGAALAASILGKTSGLVGGVGTVLVRDPADTKTVLTTVIDANGNRTSVTQT